MCQIRHLLQELLTFKFSPAKDCRASFTKITFLILWTSILLQLEEAGATYREHFVHNDRICPNPLHLHEEYPKDTLVVSLPKKLPLFGPVNDFPCNFASTSQGGVKKVIVRAIHPSRYLWDYSRAKSCDYFIKFKRSDMEHTNVHNKKDVICRVLKQEDNSYHQGSFFHPMMWNSPDHKMTLSFSTYDWEYTLGNNTSSPYKPVYLQMVFLVYADNNKYCSLRVQQYLIDPLKSINMSKSCNGDFQHCGRYDCSEAKFILESIGFRTYEIDELEYERRKHFNNDSSIDSNETISMSGKIKSGRGRDSLFHRSAATEETDRSLSTLHEYDTFITTKGTVTIYNSSNPVMNSFHSYAVTSIIVVPLVVLIVAVLAIRCYISRSRNGYRTYESHESLIVPLNRHPIIMNTHVSEDGNVILGEVLPSHRFWSRDYSMDYIQPVDLRSLHLSLGGSKTTISAPPSYETLGPPRYSDAVVI